MAMDYRGLLQKPAATLEKTSFHLLLIALREF